MMISHIRSRKTLLKTTVAFTAFTMASAASPQSIAGQGGTGYIDMPSAYMNDNGEVIFTYFSDKNVSGTRLGVQAAPRLNLSVTKGTYKNWGVSEAEYEDASVDVKFQILEESNVLPAVAFGATDLFQSGVRSGEYFVASKKLGYGLEASAGIGWGRFGGEQSADSDRGEFMPYAVSADHMFSGESAFFAGAAWQTPLRGLTVKAEYSTDPMGFEQVSGDFIRESDLNFGASYEIADILVANAYTRYGDGFGFSLTAKLQPNNPLAQAADLAGPSVFPNRDLLRLNRSTDWAATDAKYGYWQPALEALEQNKLTTTDMDITANSASIFIRPTGSSYPKAIGRTARILAATLPASVEQFEITLVNDAGLPMTTAVINRSDLEALVETFEAGPQSWQTTQFVGAPTRANESIGQGFDYGFGITPGRKLSEMMDDGILVYPYAELGFRLNQNLSLSSRTSLNIWKPDTVLDQQRAEVRVRTDEDLYRQDGATLEKLTVDYVTKLAPSVFARASAGYLDTQFGGVSGEVLFAPAGSQFAAGFEVNRVTKRDPADMFGFGDYEVTSGHASLYYDTLWNDVSFQVDYGKYLAGDWGGAMHVSKRFLNGWELRGSLTATDGYFDSEDNRDLVPEIALTIPLGWITPLGGDRSVTYRPVSVESDYGQRVEIENRLYPMVDDYRLGNMYTNWGSFWQ